MKSLKIKKMKTHVFKNDLLKKLVHLKSGSLGIPKRRVRACIMECLGIGALRLSLIEHGKAQPSIDESFWFLDFFCNEGMKVDNINIFYTEVKK